MIKFGFVKYCVDEFGFLNRNKLIYSGYHVCSVKGRGIYRGTQNAETSKCYLLLESEDEQFAGEIIVDGSIYDKFSNGKVYKQLSIITNSKGCVRFTEEPDPDKAIGEINKAAKEIAVQIVIGFIMLFSSAAFLLLSKYLTR